MINDRNELLFLLLFISKKKLNYTSILSMKNDPVIEVKNVWKSFKTVQAVKGIDLNIPKVSLLPSRAKRSG